MTTFIMILALTGGVSLLGFVVILALVIYTIRMEFGDGR